MSDEDDFGWCDRHNKYDDCREKQLALRRRTLRENMDADWDAESDVQGAGKVPRPPDDLALSRLHSGADKQHLVTHTPQMVEVDTVEAEEPPQHRKEGQAATTGKGEAPVTKRTLWDEDRK